MDKPLIIFDTDMDTDCDDAGALGLLLEFVKQGKADLLGIIADTPTEYAAPCCEAICDWYGVKVPIGAVSFEKYKDDDRFDDYRKHTAGISEEKYYNKILATQIKKSDTDYKSAALMYRELLANATDNSVTVVCVGLLTAVYELFQTEKDSISELSGIELFCQKVKYVVSMGNADFPEQTRFNFNYKMDKTGATGFFEKCPVPIYVSKEGTNVITGNGFSVAFSKQHPLRIAYESFMGGANIGRQSWDLIAVLYAVNPDSKYFKTETHGAVRFKENKTYWISNTARKDYIITLNTGNDEMAEMLDAILIKGE